MFGRKKNETSDGIVDDGHVRNGSDRTLTNDFQPSKQQVKRATRTRLVWSFIASFCLLLAVIFLILVEVGNTSTDKVRSSINFIKLDLTNIVPTAIPNAVLINSIAQTLGLHDFYTVGLWGFCEGYNGQGTTNCSQPKTLYWFDPVSILQSELLAGASIALPAQVDEILGLIRTVSHWMFALFLAGACVNFLMIFIIPLSVFSRWATLPIMLLTFLGALFTTVAAIIATVLFVIMKDAVTSVTQINIGASIGVKMFAFMWIAAGTSILAWLIELCLTCCCASRRDVKKGKKRGSKKAWTTETPGISESEKPRREKRGMFGR